MSDSVYFSERTKTYDIPLSHLDFKYLDSCNDIVELEKILKTLRSGEVGRYAELESFCEEKISLLNPNSRILRKTVEPIKISQLDNEERCRIEKDFQSWLNEMKSFDEENDCKGNLEDDYYLLTKSKKKLRTGVQLDVREEELEEKCLQYGNENLPPIRRTVIFSNKDSSTRVSSSGDYTFGNRILKPKDYSEWDKLAKEWDKELAEDNQMNSRSEKGEIMKSSEIETRGLKNLDYKELKLRVVNMPIQTRKKLAEHEKDKGNESFKSGDYADALNYYKRSLIIHKTNTVYNNRALIYLRQKQWNEAVNDCTKVLKTEPDNLKALFRRSQANFELDNLEQAEKDLNRLTDQDPTNFKAQNLLRNVKIAISKRQRSYLEGSRRMIITDVGVSSGDDDDDDDEDNDETEGDILQQQQLQKLEIVTKSVHETEPSSVDIQRNECYSDDIDANENCNNPNIQLSNRLNLDTDKQETSLNTLCENNNRKVITADDGDIVCRTKNNERLENEEMSIGDMNLSLTYFNKCIELCLKHNLANDKRLAVIYRNRSLVYLQMSEYQSAYNDCTLALSIEPNCPIALYRRSLALKFLGDHVSCLNDLQKAYSLCPNNNKIIEELQKMQNTVAQTNKMNTEPQNNKSTAGITTSTISTTSDIEIIELPNVEIEEEDNVGENGDDDDDKVDFESEQDNHNKEEENDESYDNMTLSMVSTDFSKFQSSDTNNKLVMSKSIDNEWEEVNLVKEREKTTNTTTTTTNNNNNLNKPIRTSHEFQTYWMNIQYMKRSNRIGAIKEIITLLKNISPELLPTLIGIRMEAEMLDDMLNAINVSMTTGNDNSLYMYDILIQLSKTARFDCALFLINDETKEGKCLLNNLD
ncbi:Sperm-associated antigen 1 [Schistosoma japonicum]|uniref:Sperm-associated antigen 1 n=1 Tax=Schistosoma japonicum TaxID=6182 RepID=A0A4Z2DJ89_SCHJA|nr:Sperm-associated antigen 1 [Schistosoma japonicum]